MANPTFQAQLPGKGRGNGVQSQQGSSEKRRRGSNAVGGCPDMSTHHKAFGLQTFASWLAVEIFRLGPGNTFRQISCTHSFVSFNSRVRAEKKALILARAS